VGKRDKKSFYIPAVMLLVQLVLHVFIKHSNQNLPSSDFNLRNIGNLFLVILYFIAVAGLFFKLIKPAIKLSEKVIYFYAVITWLLLLAAFISPIIDPGLSKIYLLGQTGNRLLTGLLYFAFMISFISFIVYVWGRIISGVNFSSLKNIYSSFLVLLIFLLLTFIYSFSIKYTSEKWELVKNSQNTVVVPGAAVWSGDIPSPTLSGRVNKALELVNSGYAGKILLTGSNAPGELTEAEAALNYLLAKGVDTSFISIETGTTSTSEQIQFIKSNISARENAGDIIVVSDSYHLPRIVEIAEFINVEIKVAESGHTVNFEDKVYNYIRESVALFMFWCFAL